MDGFPILILIGLQVAYTLSVILHELAHTLAACVVGLRVHAIRFGSGAPLITGRCCGVDVHLCGYPALGWTEAYPSKPKGYRWKTAVMCVAGPMMNALLVAGFIPVFEATKTSGLPIDSALLFTSAMMIIVNFLMLILTLMPYAIRIGKAQINSDGLQLIKAVKSADESIAKLVQVGRAVQAARLAGGNNVDLATRWLRRQLPQPWSVNSLFQALGLLILLTDECTGPHFAVDASEAGR